MVDFSEVIIAQMKERHPEMVWQVMDVREMNYADDEFDLAIDKVRLSPGLLVRGEYAEWVWVYCRAHWTPCSPARYGISRTW
jgi:DNA-binding transcriptional LysR family regulator